jgi:homoserine dehydrogenase
MQDVRMIKVALAGCGTVGGGIAEIVINRADDLARRTGLRFEILKALVSNASKKRDNPLPAQVYTDQPAELTAAFAEADLVVEVIGGTTTAREIVLAALQAGKPVVTANKALLALHGAEVYRTARAHQTFVSFEASCAGGLPIIGPLLRGLQANRNHKLLGIFNSTCNFVLTKMLDDGMSYEDAVAEAQRCGYAEADPTLDVSGGDTAHKLTILASLAFGLNLEYDRVDLEGIDRLQLTDLRIAREMGYACKLLGVGERIPSDDAESVYLAVHPTLVPAGNPLAGLSGTWSGVWVEGDVLGSTFYSGAGAGALPTASAVVADMIEAATGSAAATFAALGTYNDRTPAVDYVDPNTVPMSCYVRFSVDPAYFSPAVFEQAWEKTPVAVRRVHHCPVEQSVAVITGPMTRSNLRTAVRMALADLQITGEPVVLPVLED